MLFVTGGAGFIGSNFVLDWLSQSVEPVVNLDKLTYAGNCIDPVKNCSGVIFEENTDEHTDGRRHQTLDSQAQSGAYRDWVTKQYERSAA